MNLNHLTAIICISLMLTTSAFQHTPKGVQSNVENYKDWFEESAPLSHTKETLITYTEPVSQHNPLLDYYQQESTHQLVNDFFVRLTGSEQIALPILFHAETHDVPIALFFAVAWVESRFRPWARNVNISTEDRGLFQLNSASFRQLDGSEVYNPEINTLHAARYMRYCLRNANGNPATALAIYNAGLGRVRSGSIPRSTQVYISRVLSYRSQIIRSFNYYLNQHIAQENETGT